MIEFLMILSGVACLGFLGLGFYVKYLDGYYRQKIINLHYLIESITEEFDKPTQLRIYEKARDKMVKELI